MKLPSITLLLLLLAAVLFGCSGDPAPAPLPETAGPAASESSGPQASPVPSQERLRAVAHHRRSFLVGVRVDPAAHGHRIEAWWRCRERSCPRPRTVVAISEDDFSTVRYLSRPSSRMPPDRIDVPDGLPHALAGLMPWPLPSLVPGTRAVLGGGDGATLFPFEKVARQRGATHGWEVFDVAARGGPMPYASGGAVLGDGRLLTLVTNWSDDRRGKPSARPHGLVVSPGDDWSRFEPVGARFRPPLVRTSPWPEEVEVGASGGERPVVWVTTSTMLYLSSDDARTFRGFSPR